MAKKSTRGKTIVFRSRLKKARDVSLEAWESGLRSIKKDVKAEVQEQIGTQGPPRSTAFNPPHKDSGKLHKGITVVVEKGARGRAAAIVIKADRTYAEYLITGTSRMSPRPFGQSVLTGGRRKTTLSKKWVERIARVARQKTKSKATRTRRRTKGR